MSTAKAADLDAMLEVAFTEFRKSLVKSQGSWFGKERDCVNRFVMEHLVPLCLHGRFPVKAASQIGIEVAVRQPKGIGTRPSAPKDVVIWKEPSGTCWDTRLRPIYDPLAIIEWKVRHPRAVRTPIKLATSHDRRWLKSFTARRCDRLGYSVYLDWSQDWRPREFVVARCEAGKLVDEWLAWH